MSKRFRSIFTTKCFAQKRFFPRKSSHGNVECSFDNPVEKKPSTSKNVSLRSESHDEKIYYPTVFKKKFPSKKFPKNFSWHVKCNFFNSGQNNCAKSPN